MTSIDCRMTMVLALMTLTVGNATVTLSRPMWSYSKLVVQ